MVSIMNWRQQEISESKDERTLTLTTALLWRVCVCVLLPSVFYLLMGFCFLSAMTLQRIVKKEVGPRSTWRPLRQWCSRTPRDDANAAAAVLTTQTPNVTGPRATLPLTSSMSAGAPPVTVIEDGQRRNTGSRRTTAGTLDGATVASGSGSSSVFTTPEEKLAAELRAGLMDAHKVD